MTPRTASLTDLLGRLEGAEGADRELDALVFLACGLDAAAGSAMSGEGVDGKFRFREGEMLSVLVARYPRLIGLAATVCQPPHVTACLDAALALVERVLPGWAWMAGCAAGGGFFCALQETIDDEMTLGGESDSFAKTPALALLTALVSALLAQEVQG